MCSVLDLLVSTYDSQVTPFLVIYAFLKCIIHVVFYISQKTEFLVVKDRIYAAIAATSDAAK